MKNFNNFVDNDTFILEKINVNKTLNKTFNLLKNNVNKQTIKYFLVLMLGFYTVSEIIGFLNTPNITQNITQNNLSMIKTQLSDTTTLKILKDKADTTKMTIIDKNSDTIKENNYKDPQTIKLSQDGWDNIRNHEKLKLTAYDIGDGKITIGWGHAEPKTTSKYKIGDKISKEKAKQIFIEDVNHFAEGTRRMFRQWKEMGSDVKITQGQYDAIVSLMFNGGITGFRRSSIATYLYDKEYNKASNAILSFKVSDEFSGNYKRREDEKKSFDL